VLLGSEQTSKSTDLPLLSIFSVSEALRVLEVNINTRIPSFAEEVRYEQDDHPKFDDIFKDESADRVRDKISRVAKYVTILATSFLPQRRLCREQI
jgi:hypothetical protein